METEEVITKLEVIGCALAIVVSWSTNESIIWALVHGGFGWFYLLYYVLIR